ncbi:MAG TPA: hypothetical protein VKT30_17165 [Caulobacteraceae bacterium]|nr:hypothetical protein [Caulobacteraceae bacterium]
MTKYFGDPFNIVLGNAMPIETQDHRVRHALGSGAPRLLGVR